MATKPRYLLIDSRDRSASLNSSTDFIVYFQPNIVGAKSVSLQEATIPNTQYSINSSNNLIYFTDGSGSWVGTITPGSYNTITILTAIATAMNAVSSGYSATYNSSTFFITISNSGDFELTFGTNTTDSAAYPLGFANANTTSATSQTSVNAVDFIGPLYFGIRIDQIPINTRSSNEYDFYTFIVSNQALSDSSINYWSCNNDFDQTIDISGMIYISQFHVQLLTHDNTLVNLNGSDWNFMLRLDYE